MAARGSAALAGKALRRLQSSQYPWKHSWSLCCAENHIGKFHTLRSVSSYDPGIPRPPCLSRSIPLHFFCSGASTSSKVVMVKDDAHFAEVMDNSKGEESLAVVYFTAQWCGPCKQIAPYIDELSLQFSDVKFLKLDVDNLELEETMKNSSIGVVPTFHFHKNGHLVGELTGAVKDQLKHLVKSLRDKS